jgi:EmrB/QacA subfamily drug resistance transporter
MPEAVSEQPADQTAEPPAATFDRRLVVLGVVVVLGTLLSILDATIVNVAIRTLGRDFGVSISTVHWVLTGYLLAFATVIPIAGWAVERFGAKRMWVGALLLFLAGSGLSGTAWSIEALIAFRILQGIGGGMIPPVGQAILAQAAGPLRMGRTMSMLSLPTMVGSMAGPAIGGLIVSAVGWRWIFLVNLPLGVVAVLAARRLLPEGEPQPLRRLDLRGLLLLCSGVATFVYGMSETGAAGGFESPRAIAFFGIGAALILLYVAHARVRKEHALIDMSLLRIRGFASAVTASLVVSIAMFGALLLLPLYWQVVRNESVHTTGFLLMPQAFGAAVAVVLAGRMTDRAGAAVVVPFGILLALLGTGVYTQVGTDTPHAVLVGALFVIGLGLGATNTPLLAAAYVSLSRSAIPGATSAFHTVRRLGGSVGAAALAVVLQQAIVSGVPTLRGSALEPLPAATHARVAPALANAFGTAFWVAFGLLVIALAASLLLPRVRSSQ